MFHVEFKIYMCFLYTEKDVFKKRDVQISHRNNVKFTHIYWYFTVIATCWCQNICTTLNILLSLITTPKIPVLRTVFPLECYAELKYFHLLC